MTDTTEVLALPGVVGVCTGSKLVGGIDTGQPARVVLVAEKRAEVPKSERIPHMIDWLHSDVIEAPLEWLATPSWRQFKRPVQVGDGIGQSNLGTGGSVGGYYVAANNAGEPTLYMLTAGHVTPELGAEVSQPGGKSQIIAERNRYGIGTVERVVLPWEGNDPATAADAAAIVCTEPDEPGVALQSWIGVQAAYGTKRPPVLVFQPSLARGKVYSALAGRMVGTGSYAPHCLAMPGVTGKGDWVLMRGARSGVRRARLFSDDLQVRTRYSSALGWRDVHLTGLHAYLHDGPGMVTGDSGALVWSNLGDGHGSGMATVVMASPTLTVGIPLRRQLAALHPEVEVMV